MSTLHFCRTVSLVSDLTGAFLLMFDAVRKNRRLAQVIVVLIALPFAFFGMESYFRDTPANTEVAKVAGEPIYEAEFLRALQEQQDRLRQTFGANLDQALLNSEPLRRNVLESLINQRILAHYVRENHLTVSLPALQESIAGISAFHDESGFSLERYNALLRNQGMSQVAFEAAMRQDLTVQQVVSTVNDARIVPRNSARQWLEAQLETRQVRVARFSPPHFLDGIEISDEAVQAHYDAHPDRFQEPARLKAQYLVFGAGVLAKTLMLDEEALLAWYEANKTRFSTPEERQVRHILLTLEADAPQADVDAARQTLEGLRAQLVAAPERFAELAQAHSQDPGSADQGGDLGFFGRGIMVAPFENTAFGLDVGQLSDPVRTDFGYHLIEVTDIRPERVLSFSQVRADVEKQMREERAQRLFAEEADEFSNLVYEQVDRLDEVARRFRLTVQETEWIEEGSALLGEHAAPEVVAGLFQEPLRTNGHNSDAKEIVPGLLLAARVTDYRARQQQPLDTVREAIRASLALEKAREKAQAESLSVLEALQAGTPVPSELVWEKHNLSRHTREWPADLIKRLFALEGTGSALPRYLGGKEAVTNTGDFVVMALDRIEAGILPNEDPRLQAGLTQIEDSVAEQDVEAFMDSLRARYGVSIKPAVFETRP